jgi:hypothetical protein
MNQYYCSNIRLLCKLVTCFDKAGSSSDNFHDLCNSPLNYISNKKIYNKIYNRGWFTLTRYVIGLLLVAFAKYLCIILLYVGLKYKELKLPVVPLNTHTGPIYRLMGILVKEKIMNFSIIANLTVSHF